MRKMTSDEIRNTFLEYFKEHGHTILPSASLLIKNDPTLFYIERNGVEFSISYMEDNEEIGVTFTQVGQKLYSFSKSIYTTMSNAYDQIQTIEKIFGVKIID